MKCLLMDKGVTREITWEFWESFVRFTWYKNKVKMVGKCYIIIHDNVQGRCKGTRWKGDITELARCEDHRFGCRNLVINNSSSTTQYKTPEYMNTQIWMHFGERLC